MFSASWTGYWYHFYKTTIILIRRCKKGSVPGTPGCMEHTGVISQLLKEAKTNEGNLAALCFDRKNAYGSIPHKLVELRLKRYHVLDRISNLILDYYNFQDENNNEIPAWYNLKRCIITGCTISSTLFTLAMNLLIKTAELECKGPVTRSGERQTPIRAYMDDMTITTTSTIGARWVLKGIGKLVTWARMSFNALKSWSLVLKKGIAMEKECFKLPGETNPTIQEKSIKSQGKLIERSLRDTIAIQDTKDNPEKWLTKVDKSGLPGRFKGWVYQHAILPKILWLLSIYEFTMAHIVQMVRKINSFSAEMVRPTEMP